MTPVRGKLVEVRDRGILVDVDFEESLGIYGEEFWTQVGNNNYESSTFDFIDSMRRQGSEYFFDIGAATGCMTLYAASISFTVISVEPQTEVFQALMKNISLNNSLSLKITPVQALIVSEDSIGKIDTRIDHKFFTIGAGGPLGVPITSIPGVSCQQLLAQIPINAKLSAKMDVEGAEFEILKDKATLLEFQKRRVVLYLSFHPGFQHPLPVSPSFMTKTLWEVRTIFETIQLVRKISRYANIHLLGSTNFLNWFQVLRLLREDHKDFILEFGN